VLGYHRIVIIRATGENDVLGTETLSAIKSPRVCGSDRGIRLLAANINRAQTVFLAAALYDRPRHDKRETPRASPEVSPMLEPAAARRLIIV